MDKRLFPIVILFFLLTVILGPLFGPGHVFLMDATYGDVLLKPSFTNLSFPIYYVMWLLNQVIPLFVIEKLIYFGIFLFLSIGTYLLIPFQKRSAKLFFAGLLCYNPFTYYRFLGGHWLVLVGYALSIPLFLLLLRPESVRKYWGITILLLLLGISSPHYFLVGIGLVFSMTIARAVFVRDVSLRTMGPFILLFFLTGIGYSIITSHAGNVSWFARFDESHLAAFRTTPDSTFGIVPNILSLFGFWYESEEHITALKQIVPFWIVIGFGYLWLFLSGCIEYWKRERSTRVLACVAIGIGIVALILMVGVASPWTKSLTVFLYTHIHLLYVLREPQKLAGILALLYAFFGAYYLEHASFRVRPFVIIPLLVAYLYVYGFLIGYAKDLKTAEYPVAWQEARTFLYTHKLDTHPVLVFPWHTYLRFSFIDGKKVYNPAFAYFGNAMIVANTYESPDLYSNDFSDIQRHITGLLSMEYDGINASGDPVDIKPSWGRDTAPFAIATILLLKEDDWQRYAFLDTQIDLHKVFENDRVVLYQNGTLYQPK